MTTAEWLTPLARLPSYLRGKFCPRLELAGSCIHCGSSYTINVAVWNNLVPDLHPLPQMVSKARCIMHRAQCKMQMRAPLFNSIKNFKMARARR